MWRAPYNTCVAFFAMFCSQPPNGKNMVLFWGIYHSMIVVIQEMNSSCSENTMRSAIHAIKGNTYLSWLLQKMCTDVYQQFSEFDSSKQTRSTQLPFCNSTLRYWEWMNMVIYIIYIYMVIQLTYRRKFKGQTSDNMDIWKEEMGRVREEKRREEERRSKRESLRRKKIQVREQVGKSRNTVFFQWFVAPEGRKVGSLKRRVRSHVVRWEMKSCTPLWREAHF